MRAPGVFAPESDILPGGREVFGRELAGLSKAHIVSAWTSRSAEWRFKPVSSAPRARAILPIGSEVAAIAWEARAVTVFKGVKRLAHGGNNEFGKGVGCVPVAHSVHHAFIRRPIVAFGPAQLHDVIRVTLLFQTLQQNGKPSVMRMEMMAQ